MSTNKPTFQSWETLKREKIVDHPYVDVYDNQVRLPSGKETSYVTFGMRQEAVTVVCIDGDKVLVQEQYNYPIDQSLMQFPGGKVDKDESIEAAARRELSEESQYDAQTIEYIGWFYPMNRRSDAKMHVVLGTDPRPTNGVPDDEEQISSQWMPITELQEKIAAGEVHNYALLAAWALYSERKKNK